MTRDQSRPWLVRPERRGARTAAIHLNLCAGMPPFVIEAPATYWGIQVFVGLACCCAVMLLRAG